MTDKELIEALGGPTELARRLGYATKGGAQRVHNWMTRGIPPRVRLDHADVFAQPPQSRSAHVALCAPALLPITPVVR